MERTRAPGAARNRGEDRAAYPDARDRLTAQKLQIAQLAAAGLSNREIGERLFVIRVSPLTRLPFSSVASRTMFLAVAG